MVNANKNISKLLYALSIKGEIYKINSYNYYNENKNKYSTKYLVLKRKIIKEYDVITHKFYDKEKYINERDIFYNKIDLMKYLAEEYRKVCEEYE